jgi:hypothetical protein
MTSDTMQEATYSAVPHRLRCYLAN